MSVRGEWSLVAELHAYAFAERLSLCDVHLALSPDGRRIITMPYSASFFDDPLKAFDLHPVVWDADSGELLHTLRHPQKAVSFTVSSDGERIVTTALDSKVRIWDITSGELLKAQEIDIEDDESEKPLIFDTDGRAVDYVVLPTLHTYGLLSHSIDDVLQIIDPNTGNTVRVVEGGSWQRFALSADAKVVVEGSVEGWSRYWDAEGEQRYLLSGGPVVTCVAVSSDGSRIATGSTNGDIQVWDTQSGEEVNAVHIHDHSIDRLEITADGRIALAKLHNGPIKVWYTDTDLIDEVPVWGDMWRVSADGRRVVIAHPEGDISIFHESSVAGKKIWTKAIQQVGDRPNPLTTAKENVMRTIQRLVSQLRHR